MADYSDIECLEINADDTMPPGESIKRVALLMGSFNPMHRGHLAVARYVAERGLADEVWLVVSPQNPLKNPMELAPFDDRLEMVRRAVAEAGGGTALRVCDVERDLSYPSYTIHTIEVLQRCYPDVQFTILAGSDIADQLSRWYRAEELQRMVRFLIYPRNGGTASPEMEQAPTYGIDSTSIRQAAAAGRSFGEWVAEAVGSYIRERGLYGVPTTVEGWTAWIEREPEVADRYFERGRLHYRNNDFGLAINDFNRTLELEPGHTAARQMLEMTQAIFNFRNFDLYNP